MRLAFEREDGTLISTALVEGYAVGDRLLEGVMFEVHIQPDNTYTVNIAPQGTAYFEQLNADYWLPKIHEYCQDLDMFTCPDTGEDVWPVEIHDNGESVMVELGSTKPVFESSESNSINIMLGQVKNLLEDNEKKDEKDRDL